MPPRRSPSLAPYRLAQLRARALAGRLSATSIQAIRQALKEYADTIAGRLAALPADPSPARLRQILRDMHEVVEFAADRLEGRLLKIVGKNRAMSFEETREIWEKAGDLARELVERHGLTPGAVSVPGLQMAGAYEALGGAARTWKTLLPQLAKHGAAEVDAIVRGALLQGTSPDKLARVLRRYVVGSRPFESLAREMGLKVNLQDLRSLAQQALHDPRARVLLNASQVMRHNAERIAFTEVFNARREAEIQQYATDPMVAAVAWRLAPDRGTLVGADECDDYAAQDAYGLGPGIYPVEEVPVPPHPWCRSVPSWTPVLTRNGWKAIEQIKPNEEVLTHGGRLCSVEETIHGRETKGDWLALGTSSGILIITEDHPVLTDRGWVDAGLLVLGDRVVVLKNSFHDFINKRFSGRSCLAPMPIAIDDYKAPFTAIQKLLLSAINALLLRRRVPATVDFDGESNRWNSKVEIEFAHRPKREHGHTFSTKARECAALILTKALIAINRFGSVALCRKSLHVAGEYELRASRLFLSEVRISVISEPIGVGLASEGNTAARQVICDEVPTPSRDRGNLINRSELLGVHADHGVDLFRSVRLTHIVPLPIGIRHYCLTVVNDKSFVANGQVIHNCELVPVAATVPA